MPTEQAAAPKLKTNLDTDLLKLIAILMLIFYLCRNRPALGAGLYVLSWLPALWNGYLEDPKSLLVAGHAIDWTIFGLLSVFPIYLPTHTGIKIPKLFFYGFYPVHLAAIGVVRLILNV